MYAYALEAVEQEARAFGTSIIDARDDFHHRFTGGDTPAAEEEKPAPSRAREQAKAQAELMALMGKAARG